MFPRVKQKLFFLVYVGMKCWTTRMYWTWVSMGQVHVKSIYHSPSSVVIKVLKNKTKEKITVLAYVILWVFTLEILVDLMRNSEFVFFLQAYCSAWHSVSFWWSYVLLSIPSFQRVLVAFQRSWRARWVKHPDLLRTLFWYFENEAVFYRKRAIDF